jgi:hypothetical protein
MSSRKVALGVLKKLAYFLAVSKNNAYICNVNSKIKVLWKQKVTKQRKKEQK